MTATETLCRDVIAGLESARRDVAALKRDLLARKFDPNQPRVPKDQPGGGRWTKDFLSADARLALAIERVDPQVLAQAGGRGGRGGRGPSQRLDAICEAQLAMDVLVCRRARPNRRESCYAQANQRYSNCLSGRQIPPLNY